MRKLNKDDLESLQYFADVLRHNALDSLSTNHDHRETIWYLTKAIVEVIGHTDFDIYNNDYIASLKREIKTQRKEIAALREERRIFLNNDIPPNRGCDGI